MSENSKKKIENFKRDLRINQQNISNLSVKIRKFIQQIRFETIKKLKEKENETDLENIEIINAILERLLEEMIISPNFDKINGFIKKKNELEDQKIHDQIQKLKKKNFDYFGLPNQLSKIDWSLSSRILRTFNICKLPYEFLNVLLTTADSVFHTINSNILNHDIQSEPNKLVTGDDFLPIFVFVLVNSQIENLVSISEYLIDYSDPKEMNHESGYYLTTFCSSIQFIKTSENL
ncbi:rab gdp/gtp exchange factor [Anaeramoeba ignava]|uniref:Rab gdp/gtp exchange factor n=1 Tax=Anaeramoeba ignava TaxID=1746090 RepID=A0A9Q0LKD0_ANAIG|nr:rab gdp/gtp exchange factor [Anaeramoeba ignava]